MFFKNVSDRNERFCCSFVCSLFFVVVMGNGNKVINIKLRPRLFLEEIEEANEVLQVGNLKHNAVNISLSNKILIIFLCLSWFESELEVVEKEP